MSLIIDEHRQYLADASRLDAFARAIQSVIRPGSIVLDLASGTGILGLLACRAGAAKVYSIEVSGMTEVARGVAAENGYADRIHFIKGFSTQVDLPERVDVVIADQIGNFGFNAGTIEYFADAAQRFLKPGGVFIPRRLALFLAPVESHENDSRVGFWREKPEGFRFDSVEEFAANTGYQVDFEAHELLGKPALLADLALGVSPDPIKGRVSMQVDRAGTLHGLGGWFTAELAPGISMTNAPGSPSRINRRQIHFPIRPALAVAAGDRVEAAMSILPKEGMVSWSVEIDGKGGRRQSRRHSTLKGMLLAREDLARTMPGHVPVLTARGEARRSVLEACDGVRTLQEVEQEVQRRHAELFKSQGEAQAFVAEVVTRYTR
jgi:SAM-dependent methyltransferase